MLLYVRHGKTALNLGGTKEALRGWLPVPLTPEGRQQAKDAGQQLKGIRPDTFSSSDLPRAMETAQIVGKAIGKAPAPDTNIRDWHTGDLAGKKFVDVKDHLMHLVDNPDEPAPNGESLNTYLNRFVPAMRSRITDPGLHVVVGHARGASILEGIASPVGGVGGDIDKAFLKARPNTQPGEILQVPPTWDVHKMTSRLQSLDRLRSMAKG